LANAISFIIEIYLNRFVGTVMETINLLISRYQPVWIDPRERRNSLVLSLNSFKDREDIGVRSECQSPLPTVTYAGNAYYNGFTHLLKDI
jgi:hypothetical protein